MKYGKEAISLVKLIFTGFERKHLPVVAAGLAYYFLMSLFPALVVLTAVTTYLPIHNGGGGATSFIAHLIPHQSLALIEPVLNTITPHRTGLLSFGIITTLWLSSVGAKGVIAGLDIVYEVRVPRSLWVNRVLAFVLTFAVGALLLFVVILTLVGPLVESALATAVPFQSLWVTVWPYIQWLLAAAFTFTAIELLYLLAPNVPMARRITVPGALIAATAWLALVGALGFFFHHFGQLKLNGLYGVFAAPIALVIWMKWGAVVILVGAEINVSLQTLKVLRQSKPEAISHHRKDAA